MINIKPCGHILLVKIEEVETKSAGGIILETERPDERRRHEDARQKGRLVKIGPNAWKDISDGTPWAKENDQIFFKRFAGCEIRDPEKKELYRLMSDEDCIAVVEEPK